MSTRSESDYWAKKVAEHAIWEQAEALAQGLRDLNGLRGEVDDPDAVTRVVQRGLRLLDELKARLRGVSPELVPQNVVSAALNQINTAATHVDNFKQQPENAQYLQQAESTLDPLAEQVMALPAPPAHDEAEVVVRAVQRVREVVLDAVSTGQDGARSAEERFEELQGAHEKELAARDQRLAAAQKRIDELETKITDAADLVKSQQSSVESQLTDSVDSVLTHVRDYRDQARALVNEASAEVIGGGYAEDAAKQRKQANLWRWIAVALGTVAGGLALVSLYVMDEATADQTIRTVTASIAFFAVAGYAGGQSGAHRRREEFALKASLELATLEPYLATLPESVRDTVRATYATHFFTQPLLPPKEGEDKIALAERIAGIISNARGRDE